MCGIVKIQACFRTGPPLRAGRVSIGKINLREVRSDL